MNEENLIHLISFVGGGMACMGIMFYFGASILVDIAYAFAPKDKRLREWFHIPDRSPATEKFAKRIAILLFVIGLVHLFFAKDIVYFANNY